MKTVFVLRFSKKEFEGSLFALWRHLWLHRLPKETESLPLGSIIYISLPVSPAEIPFMGQRNRALLLRRLAEIIPPGAPCLSRDEEALPEFIKRPQSETVRSLGAFFLPEILTCIRRQWGRNLMDGRVSVFSENGTFLPPVRALAPFARSIDVITPALPDYEEQERVMEEWGLTVCFRDRVPQDTSFLILWNGDFPALLPKDSVTLSFLEGERGDINPSRIFFRAPSAFSRLSSALGGIKLQHLAVLNDLFWGEGCSGAGLKEYGFSVSRIAKFWC